MDTQITGNPATLRRKPLQPRNTPANPVIELPSKPTSSNEIPSFKLKTAVLGSKENTEITTALPLPAMASGDFLPPADALSLAEELGAARRLKERLRLEREKTETILRDKDLVLEKEAREAERRELEHIELEVKLQSLLHLFELRSLLRFDTISSLRQQEEDKRKEDLLMGQSRASPARCEAEDAESSAANEKGLLSPITVSH
ncbi:high mobility group B protein 6-like [Phalaenopsis equestris]|uniref:high mobility group B protein 6-like n=1 Tax=Phalaenopsis equestris TaxID=78828 RepID=UPI0009E2B737|nr:high mobility group B protein 6-like [Phalaenopsis equestris]